MSGARAVIKSSTMVQDELEEAIKVSTMALHSTNSEQEAAAQIKQTFEQRTNRTWHCLVGRNFACYVTYESKSFAYFLHRAAGRLPLLHGLGLSETASRRPRLIAAWRLSSRVDAGGARNQRTSHAVGERPLKT